MSWNDYITDLIARSQFHCDKVAIIGLGGEIWTTPNVPEALALSAEEAQKIAKAVREENESEFQQNGVVAEEVKYQYLRRDENAYYSKKKDNGFLTLQKTKTGVILAHTKEGSQVGETNKAVAVIAEYFESLNL